MEALSVNLRQQTLDGAARNITSLSGKIERAKQTDARRLREEYQRLVNGRHQCITLAMSSTTRVLSDISSYVVASILSLSQEGQVVILLRGE